MRIWSGSRVRMPPEPTTVMGEGKENEWVQIEGQLVKYQCKKITVWKDNLNSQRWYFMNMRRANTIK